MKRWIPLSGLSPPHVHACLKSLPRYPSAYAVVISLIRSVKDISELFVFPIITI
jgi:hypothetical protein